MKDGVREKHEEQKHKATVVMPKTKRENQTDKQTRYHGSRISEAVEGEGGGGREGGGGGRESMKV